MIRSADSVRHISNQKQQAEKKNTDYQIISKINSTILSEYILKSSDQNNIQMKFLIGRQAVKVKFNSKSIKQDIKIVLHVQQLCFPKGQLLRYMKKAYTYQHKTSAEDIRVFKGYRKFIILALQVKTQSENTMYQFQGYRHYSEINLGANQTTQKNIQVPLKFSKFATFATQSPQSSPFVSFFKYVLKKQAQNKKYSESQKQLLQQITTAQINVSINIDDLPDQSNVKEQKKTTSKS